MRTLTSDEQALLRRIRHYHTSEGLADFAKACLRIRLKQGGAPVPLVLNTAQLALHAMLEKQRRETGKVRALVLKGRQMGISTYTAARFYRDASLRKGISVYILTHMQDATDNLFSMVDRFHQHNPLAPHVGACNAKELVFDVLDSAYNVATAGAKAGGRSRTVNRYHGSELAFWTNARDHFAASVQAVADMPDTEIILESTANGPTGEFFERWQDAEAGRSEYIPCFLPWYWMTEYRRTPPEGFVLSGEVEDNDVSEREYARMWGLDDAQMLWRRGKVQELRSACLFDQEYPATAALAFTSTDADSYIKSTLVLRARKADIEGGGPLVMGIDPAGEGGDRFAVVFRRGHEVTEVLFRNKIGAVEAVEWIDELIQSRKPDLVNVDAGGLGHSLIGFLRARRTEYARLVKAVNFGSKSQAKMAQPRMPGPRNRRDEMWKRMAEWFALEEGVSIPDDDTLQADLVGPRRRSTLVNDFGLESKDDMRKRGLRSPDLADALALTFADNSFILRWNEPGQGGSTPYGSADMGIPAGSGGGGGPNSWMGV